MNRFLRSLRRWRRGDILAATAVAAALGLIVTAGIALGPFFAPPPASAGDGGPSAAQHDLAGNPVQLDGPDPVPSASATPEGVGRFTAPSVGLDVPLGAMNVVDGVLQPPGFTSAYWVRNLGVSPDRADAGTVFVVMHSLRGGGVGPGNALIDVDAARARIAVGADISVADVHYRVDRTQVVDKTAIGSDADVWANTAGRLVVVTCLQRSDGLPSTENLVIEARRVT
ncbi:class F sortase [Microbacterium sp. 20-116]|uniref:class F sortase n=1 Tax=unclassified Microbacterium TaxID=2609290 RepID=UPI000E26C642|nr:class F sortase [Microbacterium sp. AG157]REC97915.1 hypothetical protein DEU35_2410 [Microbacterium sp. AG157]